MGNLITRSKDRTLEVMPSNYANCPVAVDCINTRR